MDPFTSLLRSLSQQQGPTISKVCYIFKLISNLRSVVCTCFIIHLNLCIPGVDIPRGMNISHLHLMVKTEKKRGWGEESKVNINILVGRVLSHKIDLVFILSVKHEFEERAVFSLSMLPRTMQIADMLEFFFKKISINFGTWKQNLTDWSRTRAFFTCFCDLSLVVTVAGNHCLKALHWKWEGLVASALEILLRCRGC